MHNTGDSVHTERVGDLCFLKESFVASGHVNRCDVGKWKLEGLASNFLLDQLHRVPARKTPSSPPAQNVEQDSDKAGNCAGDTRAFADPSHSYLASPVIYLLKQRVAYLDLLRCLILAARRHGQRQLGHA
jgi:hypothetical protein